MSDGIANWFTWGPTVKVSDLRQGNPQAAAVSYECYHCSRKTLFGDHATDCPVSIKKASRAVDDAWERNR